MSFRGVPPEKRGERFEQGRQEYIREKRKYDLLEEERLRQKEEKEELVDLFNKFIDPPLPTVEETVEELEPEPEEVAYRQFMRRVPDEDGFPRARVLSPPVTHGDYFQPRKLSDVAKKGRSSIDDVLRAEVVQMQNYLKDDGVGAEYEKRKWLRNLKSNVYPTTYRDREPTLGRYKKNVLYKELDDVAEWRDEVIKKGDDAKYRELLRDDTDAEQAIQLEQQLLSSTAPIGPDASIGPDRSDGPLRLYRSDSQALRMYAQDSVRGDYIKSRQFPLRDFERPAPETLEPVYTASSGPPLLDIRDPKITNLSTFATPFDERPFDEQTSGQGYETHFKDKSTFPYDKDDYFDSSNRPDAKVLDSKNKYFNNINDGPGDDRKLKFVQWWYMLRHGSKNRIETTSPSTWAESGVKETVVSFHNRYAFIDAVVYTPEKGDAFAHIFSFLVNPYVQSKGIGKRIFQLFENYLYKQYAVRRLFLEPLDREEMWDPYGFWYSLGFRYPEGSELKELSDKSRKGEPSFKLPITKQHLETLEDRRAASVDIANESRTRRNKDPIETKQPFETIGSRLFTAKHMWKDCVYKTIDPSSDNLEQEIVFGKKPDHHFSYDKNHSTKLRRANYEKTPSVDVLKKQLKDALVDIFYNGRDPYTDEDEPKSDYVRNQKGRRDAAKIAHRAHRRVRLRSSQKPNRVIPESELSRRSKETPAQAAPAPPRKKRAREPDIVDLTGPEIVDLTGPELIDLTKD